MTLGVSAGERRVYAANAYNDDDDKYEDLPPPTPRGSAPIAGLRRPCTTSGVVLHQPSKSYNPFACIFGAELAYTLAFDTSDIDLLLNLKTWCKMFTLSVILGLKC